jgi:glycosyltransferase involved in cell wall biosynthesis
LAVRSADKLAVLSESWLAQCKAVFPTKETVIVHNPCACLIEGRIYHQRKAISILYLGELCDRKGYTDLIRAFVPLLQSKPNTKLAFVGNGEIDKARQLADQLGISASIELAGWKTGNDKLRYLREADVLCLPSYQEGVPLAVLEGMGAGLPVVTTPVGGVPDFLVAGENGLLFPPGDIEALSQCLARLAANPDLRERLGKAGLSTVKLRFKPEVIAQELVSLYDAMLDDLPPSD